jgi:hypothetical protein
MSALFWCSIVLAGVLIVAAVAVPISVLTWWAGWSQRAEALPAASRLQPAAPTAGPFLVYLSGIGDISGEYQTRYEDELLEAIAMRVPGLVVITDVFGFSVRNLSMTSAQRLGWFWAWVNQERLRKRSPIKRVGQLINLRNMLHLTVSADRRYGEVYNYGVAEMILQGLVRHGYVPGSAAPITLLGYSGGAQIALATAGYVQATLQAPVQVISLGGVMNASASLDTIDRLIHLYGTADRSHRLADWIFPARWPFFPNSSWNRATAAGRITRICLGPMVHTGRNSYLDATQSVADGRSYRDVTADAVATALHGK